MKNCICCGSQKLKSYSAKIYPFVNERIGRKKDDLINLLHCSNCDFAYFDYRLSDVEMEGLYHNYRDEVYLEIRQKHEPSYTLQINQNIGKSDQEIEIKKNNIISTIKSASINLSQIKSVLDYGGDKGQNLDLSIFNGMKKFLYDITDLEPVEGVERVRELEPEQFDLVISQHVLEHVADPLAMIKKAAATLKEGGYFYFELPQDSPFFTNPKWSFFRRLSKKLGFAFPTYFNLKQKLRNKFFGMHEHINFFSEKSINKILEGAELELLTIQRSESDFYKLIYGIARKL